MTYVSDNDPMPKHHHRWQMTAHLDFCHYYVSTFACTGCRATASKTVERDPNSFSHFMFEENYVEIRRDERGRFVTPHWEVVTCERCEAIKAGAPRMHDLVIVGKDGEIEVEKHEEIASAGEAG